MSATNMGTVYGADTGSANAYAVAIDILVIAGIRAGDMIVFAAANANTGASTLAVNGGTATPIKKNVSAALASGDITAGQMVQVVYDGTNFQLMNAGSGGGGASGSLILLESHTASSSAELDFTSCISSTYDEYQIEFIGLGAGTNGGGPGIQFSTNGGTSYDTSSIYDWGQFVTRMGGATGGNGATSTTAIFMFPAGLLSSATPGMTASIKLYDPLSTTNYKEVSYLGLGHYSGDSFRYAFTGGGLYRNAAAVNAFRIVMSTGNIAAGTVRCYGVAH